MILEYDTVFEEIPDDKDNVMLNIPPEICKELGWEPGDTLTIEVINEQIHIKKHG